MLGDFAAVSFELFILMACPSNRSYKSYAAFSCFQLLIGQVQNILENAEIPELVLITGKIFHLLMEEYIEVFTEFFKVCVLR